jgi:hypothetical protein
LYSVLGFKGEDERADKARKVAAKNTSRHTSKNMANSDIGKVVTNVLTMEQRKGK